MPIVERRKTRRYEISDSNAECMAIVGNREHRAVLSDTSACGFGFMLLSGVHAEPDQRVRLVTTDGIHDCRITFSRQEDSLQHVGVERLSDVSLVGLPRRQRTKKVFRFGASGASPFVFLGVILGFVSLAGIFVIGMEMAKGSDNDEIIVIDQTPQHTPEKDRRSNVKIKKTARKIRYINSYFDELTFEERVSFNSIATQVKLSWDDLVSGLKLTRNQQRSVIALIQDLAGVQSSEQESFDEMRDGIRDVLQENQQRRFDNMWVVPPQQTPDASESTTE
jgi:hypothetical protein